MLRMLLALVAVTSAVPAQAAWNYDEVVDPITDARRPIISLRNEAGDSLVLKCDGPGTKSVYAQLISHEYLGGSGGRYGRREMIYRFDAAPPMKDTWVYDGRWAATGATSMGGNFSQFLNGLATSTKVAFRATTYQYQAVDMIFETTGSEEAIRKAFTDCRDTPLLVQRVPPVPVIPTGASAEKAATNTAVTAKAPAANSRVKCVTCRD